MKKDVEQLYSDGLIKDIAFDDLSNITGGGIDGMWGSGEVGYDIGCAIANSSWMKHLWHTNKDVC